LFGCVCFCVLIFVGNNGGGGGLFVWKALSAIFRAAWSFCWLHVM